MECFGSAPEDMVLTPPVYFDHGDKVFFGKHFYANTDLTILDENYVRFGDNVFLAPHVSIYTAGHPIDAETRNTEVEYARPVMIVIDKDYNEIIRNKIEAFKRLTKTREANNHRFTT